MPRTARFTVVFNIPSDSKQWMAEFTHKHAKEVCPHTPPCIERVCGHRDAKGRQFHSRLVDCALIKTRVICTGRKTEGFSHVVDGKTVALRHLTSVKLRHVGGSSFLTGHAPCSVRDEYNWRKGIHYAIQRALEKAGYCKLQKNPVTRRIEVVNKKPIYDEVMKAFWREVMIKAEAPPSTNSTTPVNIPIVLGPAISAMSTKPHGMGAVEHDIPAENRHGMGWAGMD